MTFSPLILFMLESNESSLVICLKQALSKNHSPYSFDSYTHKIKMKFLVPIPSWALLVSGGSFWNPNHVTNFFLFHRTCVNQMTNASTIITYLVWIIWFFGFNKVVQIFLVLFELIP
jgi:hypothetical protein